MKKARMLVKGHLVYTPAVISTGKVSMKLGVVK